MKSILVTGGTGSFGQAFVRELLQGSPFRPEVERVVVFSRSEHTQAKMAAELGDPRLRFFVGDVRDRDRLQLAMRGCDTVVHAAALKRVDTLEYNPGEAIKTNVLGAMNVIDAALATGVRRVMALSTDKASQPVNLYGASKLCAEKLFVAANAYSGSSGPIFSCVRYGNVAGSNGSVIPLWKKLAAEGKPLPVTDLRMTRFYMTLDGAVEFVLESLERMKGGEVWIPRLPSFKVTDLALAMYPASSMVRDSQFEMVGLRPGEKLHESLIGPEEAHNAFDMGDAFVIGHTIADEAGPRITMGRGLATPGRVPDGFSYSSDNNDAWLTVEGLRMALNDVAAGAAA